MSHVPQRTAGLSVPAQLCAVVRGSVLVMADSMNESKTIGYPIRSSRAPRGVTPISGRRRLMMIGEIEVFSSFV
jgi:hypothetical protein